MPNTGCELSQSRWTNALLGGELTAVHQNFLHALALKQMAFAKPAERGYDDAIEAMNRAMRLMLALMADGAAIDPGAVSREPVLGWPRLARDLPTILSADRGLEVGLLALLANPPAPVSAKSMLGGILADCRRDHEVRLSWLAAEIALLERGGETDYATERADAEAKGSLDETQDRAASYDSAWTVAETEDGDAAGQVLAGLLGPTLVAMTQSFMHAFVLRHFGRIDLANLALERSITDMKSAYMLAQLVLRGGSPLRLDPPGPGAGWQIGADVESILTHERCVTDVLLDSMDRVRNGGEGDGLAALLDHLKDARKAYDRTLDAVQSAKARGPTDVAAAPDEVGAMLGRWGIAEIATG